MELRDCLESIQKITLDIARYEGSGQRQRLLEAAKELEVEAWRLKLYVKAHS